MNTLEELKIMCHEIADHLEHDYQEEIKDALDVEQITVKSLSGGTEETFVKVYLTLGGPTVWIDTDDARVHASWGADTYEYPISYDTARDIEAYYDIYD